MLRMRPVIQTVGQAHSPPHRKRTCKPMRHHNTQTLYFCSTCLFGRGAGVWHTTARITAQGGNCQAQWRRHLGRLRPTVEQHQTATLKQPNPRSETRSEAWHRFWYPLHSCSQTNIRQVMAKEQSLHFSAQHTTSQNCMGDHTEQHIHHFNISTK